MVARQSASANQLNEQQYKAVFHRGGPLLVLAGAGSGKTRVISERIAALIESDVPEDALIAVTFTNKAAREMRERLASRLGPSTSVRLRICTFHALGLSMVREHAELLDRSANVSVFAGAEQRAVMRSVLAEMKLPADADQVERMLGRMSMLKCGLTQDASLQPVVERYNRLLKKMNAVDFDDLMLLPILLLRDREDIRALWRMRARHFLVDEYQDSSRVQYELVRLLVPPDGNLTVVGDDDQSIYGWRGAEVRNLFDLERDYPGLTVIRLEENYRSTGNILQAANTLISHNSERLGKTLRSTLGAGRPVRVWQCPNPDEEARRLAADIRAVRATSDARWDDFCVLFRASFQSRPVEMALRELKIPYHVSGGLSFFERAEIQDVLAYLRLITNAGDDLAFMRAISRPRRGVGARALEDLAGFASRHHNSLLEACLHDALEHRLAASLRAFAEHIVQSGHQFVHGDAAHAFDGMLEKTGLMDAIRDGAEDEAAAQRRLDNINELRRWWLAHAERGGSLAEFVQQVYLLADMQEDDPAGRVRLMTVHAAKGLEFAHVYVIGMEDGIFPHRQAVEESRLEEERRLMYVAMTRARFRLTLSCSRVRKRYGKAEKMAPSVFLKQIDPGTLCWVDRDQDAEAAAEEADAHMAAMRRALGLG